MSYNRKNSIIKEQQSPSIHNRNYSSSSSIELNENTDVHYYDLDYSDQQDNDQLDSSSDQQARQISHQQFMQMISTNKNLSQRQIRKQQRQQQKKHQRQQKSYQYKRHVFQDTKFNNQQTKYNKRGIQSHKKPQHHRITPSTRDKSYNLNEYIQLKKVNNHRNDPQKSSSNKINDISKINIINISSNQNQVKQFRIDSFMNSQQQINKNKKQKIFAQKKLKYIQDSDFTLITLPQYDQESRLSINHIHHNQMTHQQRNQSQKNQQYRNKQQRNLQQRKQQQRNQECRNQQQRNQRHNKYKMINDQQIRNQRNQTYDQLSWRYQQAKLKFVDSFMPHSLKIRNNPYNMLKYVQKKHQINYRILNAV